MPFKYAKAIHALIVQMADPSMFIVAPKGKTKSATPGGTLPVL